MSSTDDLSFSHTLVDMELAAKWLEQRIPIRGVSALTVGRYHRLMAAGLWVANTGDVLKFADGGRLVDGVHRLSAQIRTGEPMWWWVCNGLSANAVGVLDNGARRYASQVWASRGVSNAKDKVAALVYLDRYQRRSSKGLLSGSHAIWSVGELGRMLEGNPGIEDTFTSVGCPSGLRKIIPLSALYFVHYKASQSNPSKANEWVSRLDTGEGLVKGSSIKLLRDRLLKNSARPRHSKIPRDTVCALAVKSWIAFEEDRMLRVLKWLETESFPVFKCDQ